MSPQVKQLQQLKSTRRWLENADRVLQQLTPEEQLILEHMILHPRRGNGLKLAQQLHIETSSLYRRRAALLKRLNLSPPPQ